MPREFTLPFHEYDLSYMKPEGMKDYYTLHEMSLFVRRDPSWLRKLEQRGDIPKAHRVAFGKLNIRLWSPQQAKEIQAVIAQMRPGRPRKNG